MQPSISRSTCVAALVALVACAPADAGRSPVGPDPDRGPALALGADWSPWSLAVRVESDAAPAAASFNTPSLDGCPFQSRDGKMFFIASNRPGGLGGIDIWVSTRASTEEPWSDPANVGAPVNTAANDFCPTLDRDGHRFFFVSNRATWGPATAPVAACGGGDIYETRLRDDDAPPVFEEPVNLGCAVNSAADEASPFPLPQAAAGPVLYFSSTRRGGPGTANDGPVAGDPDIYMSRSDGGVFGAAELVPVVNGEFEDAQPNVRRDGLEIFFYSTRPGGSGLADIWSATRDRASEPWSAPVNLGVAVNSALAETRPSLSWDATTLYFGSTRGGGEGASDIYRTARTGGVPGAP